MEQNTIPGPVDARVIQRPHGFKVVPPDVPKRSQDQFTLLNLTDSTLRVSFPALPMSPPAADIPPMQLKTFTIGDARPGDYEYLVEFALNDSARGFTLRASGNSDPHIIIDF